jgi:predicted deacylase
VLWVNAGIHGAEYPGIEAAIRFAQEVHPAQLHGGLIILPVVNTPAFFDRSMYVCPLDNKNLNRVFPGREDGTISEQIANVLFHEIAPQVTHFVDLHGGDMVEAFHPVILMRNTGMPSVDIVTKEIATHFGIHSIMAIDENSKGWTGEGTLYASLLERGIPGVIAEAGELGQLDEVSVNLLHSGLLNTVKLLEMMPGSCRETTDLKWFDDFVWLYSPYDGIQYPAVEVGKHVVSGQVVCEIRDWFGEKLGVVTSPLSGTVLFNITSPAIKKGGVLIALGKPQKQRNLSKSKQRQLRENE